MQLLKIQLCPAKKSYLKSLLLLGCLLSGGSARFLAAQTVSMSAWSSKLDHSVESVLVFQSQSGAAAQANICLYDMQAQQITQFSAEASASLGDGTPGTSVHSDALEPRPSLDEEADRLFVGPLLMGADAISSPAGSDVDFMLMTQLFMAVKPNAYRIISAVAGSNDLESLAFRNPDGTYVLIAVNHSQSPVSTEVFWKDRVFNSIVPAQAVAFFAWDPKSQLVSLVPGKTRISGMEEGSLAITAKCSHVSAVSVDLRCESQAFYCSVFPIRFTCDGRDSSGLLSVTFQPKDRNEGHSMAVGSMRITATPEVGEPTVLSLPASAQADGMDR